MRSASCRVIGARGPRNRSRTTSWQRVYVYACSLIQMTPLCLAGISDGFPVYFVSCGLFSGDAWSCRLRKLPNESVRTAILTVRVSPTQVKIREYERKNLPRIWRVIGANRGEIFRDLTGGWSENFGQCCYRSSVYLCAIILGLVIANPEVVGRRPPTQFASVLW